MEEIHKTMGAEVNVTFDCVGFDKTMSTALTATNPGGRVCLVGMGHTEMTVPLTPAAARYYFFRKHFRIYIHSKSPTWTVHMRTGHLAIVFC